MAARSIAAAGQGVVEHRVGVDEGQRGARLVAA